MGLGAEKRSAFERDLQRQIEAAIGSEPDLLLLRNQVGEAVYYATNAVGDAKEYHVPYGLGVGSPDLVALLRATYGGRTVACWFCLEVKVRGQDADVHQAKCHAVWRRFGAFVAVVHSVEEAREALRVARAGA
jgi:hypothetical protein